MTPRRAHDCPALKAHKLTNIVIVCLRRCVVTVSICKAGSAKL
jgi:hypothetical protein